MKIRFAAPLLALAALALACNGATAPSSPVAPQDPLQAATSASNAGGALIFYDKGCALYDASGTLVPGQSDQYVCTPSQRNNINVKCWATVAPPASGKAVRFSYANKPVQCGTYCGQGTTRWHEVVDEFGNAVLTCNFKN
jgi:hypothetical protein